MSSSETIQVGPIAARGGEIARGFLGVGETLAGPIQIPIVLINGTKSGAVLCLTAGVHATEYAPIEAIFRILDELQPNTLSGAVIAVPIVSMHMFAARCPFVSPLDGLNLNKIAPGGSGSISEILVRTLLDEIVAKSQYHVDLHAGDFGEILMPFAGYSLSGTPDQDREGEALARAFTPRLISLARKGGSLPPFPGSICYEASRRGVISILAESGGNGTLEEADTRVHVDGVRNILRQLKMIAGAPSTSRDQVMASDRAITRATRAGLLRLKVSIGDSVAQNQVVAEICDVFGQPVETVRAARAGIAGLVWSYKAVNTGDPILRCWYT
jgi:predicted deacylase